MDAALLATAPDTATGQLVHPELGLVDDSNFVLSTDKLSIPRRLFKRLWRDGHIDNKSYCILALYFDQIGKGSNFTDFDLNAFSVKWSEHWQTEKEKKSKKGASEIVVVDHEKQLTDAQIEAALGSLEKKEQATVNREVQLNIGWGELS